MRSHSSLASVADIPGIPLLSVSDLTIAYHGERGAVRAVTDVSLDVRRGEIFGIAGESGSGKSTLLNAICRLLKYPGVVESGSVKFSEVEGRTVDILALEGEDLRCFRWARIAMVFQSALNALNPVLSIEAQMLDVSGRSSAGALQGATTRTCRRGPPAGGDPCPTARLTRTSFRAEHGSG